MTILKSRLVTPDAKAIVGRKVTATLMYRPSWINRPDKGGRALGSVTGYTDAEGIWRIELMPVTQFEEPEYVWYQIDEGGEQTWRVRFDENEGELWLKDKLIDPPPPPPDYIAIDKLGSLHDVDRDSVDHAPDGAVLAKRDGKWVAEVPNFGKDRLAELRDVDESVSWAQSTDPLVYLSSAQGWGVTREKPATIRAEFAYDPDDSYTVWIGVTAYDSSKDTAIYWGDDTDDTPVTATGDYAHTYTTAGTYYLAVYYLDQTEMVEFPNTVIPNPTPKGNA